MAHLVAVGGLGVEVEREADVRGVDDVEQEDLEAVLVDHSAIDHRVAKPGDGIVGLPVLLLLAGAVLPGIGHRVTLEPVGPDVDHRGATLRPAAVGRLLTDHDWPEMRVSCPRIRK